LERTGLERQRQDGRGLARIKHKRRRDMDRGKEYARYIASAAWNRKREERRAIDKSRCRTCGVSENLQCHHVTYKRFGDEDVERDLITLCAECHFVITGVIRNRRYSKKKHQVKPTKAKEMSYVARKKLPTKVSLSIIDAQRAVSRSAERFHYRYESSKRETKQNAG